MAGFSFRGDETVVARVRGSVGQKICPGPTRLVGCDGHGSVLMLLKDVVFWRRVLVDAYQAGNSLGFAFAA